MPEPDHEPGRHRGRVVLVSGAASGIGEATARAFAAEAAIVILTDKAQDRLTAAHDAMPRADRHRAIVLDVTIEADWIAAVAEVENEFGRLDVLVNNAGWGMRRSIVDMGLEDWRFIQAVNLDSVFLGTKYAMPLLEKSGSGAIVNVSSIRGFAGAAGSAAYCAAKGGVRLFTKAAALECAEAGKGVRVNSVHPGYVDTRALFDQIEAF